MANIRSAGVSVVLVHGAPGVGKSELAREYGRRHRGRYPGGTFFVSCGHGDEMVDLARVGTNLLGLEPGPGASIRDQAERALASLGEEPVLLIYDNATRSAPVDAWLPPSGGPMPRDRHLCRRAPTG